VYSQCEFYDLDYDKEVIWQDGEPEIRNRSEPVPCRYGWEYDTEQVASSIVIDVNISLSFKDLISKDLIKSKLNQN
jgi:hypothetical protein